jgi:5-methylcytosine-specific restriction endonuclease McrA
LKKPTNPKERNLLKSAVRRVFSRSDLRREALERNAIEHTDPERPRVTKWSWCSDCGTITPRYLMQVDHITPVIGVTEKLEDLSWTELIEDRIWCDANNLQILCLPCHKAKSKQENAERRQYKKGLKK